MNERRVALDTGAQRGLGQPGGADVGAGGAGGRPRQQADGAARELFERALQAPAAAASPTQLSGPLALFGASRAAPAAPTAVAVGSIDWSRISEGVERLMVGDGRSGRRQVRVQLKNEALPETSIEIAADEGLLLVIFTCGAERARRLLAERCAWLAAELAQRLGRATLVRVQSDDPEDRAVVEARSEESR